MAANGLEIIKLTNCVDNNMNFIFTAGAGSGKTYSLIKVLEHTEKVNKDKIRINNQKIACITYTNAGVDEIISRIPNNTNTKVCTIHEFLWSLVKHFQKELKKELKIYLIEKRNELIDKSKRARKPEKIKEYEDSAKKRNEQIISFDDSIPVTYQDKANYSKNIISHDLLVMLSIKVLTGKENYLQLISYTYPYIYIDEYQDTFPEIANLFMELSDYSLIGYFGDPMQKIYDRGVGTLSGDIQNKFETIESSINYRSAKKIVDLLNLLRTDSVMQKANKKIEGSITFLHVKDEEKFNLNKYSEKGFIEFQLIHKKIAERMKYLNLFYQFKDNLDILVNNNENRRESIIADLIFDFEFYILTPYYANKKISLKKNLRKFDILDINQMDFSKITNLRNNGSVIEYCKYLFDNNYYIIDTAMYNLSLDEEIDKTISENALVNENYKMDEFTNYLASINDNNIVTCHSTKGKEYDKVIAILNPDDWQKKYKWIEFLSRNDNMTPNQRLNTENLFYVICSRAISDLVIVLIDTESKLNDYQHITQLFGKENLKIIE